MNDVIQLLAALAGSFGFGVVFNLHGKKLAYAALGGFFSWGIYLLAAGYGANDHLCAFIASVALTVYAEIMARVHKAPVTVFLVIAAIPLIPGASLYRSAHYLMQRRQELFASQSMYTLLFAASMSAGITLTSLVLQIVRKLLPHKAR